MKLYILRTCPYCAHVMSYVQGRNLDLEIVEVPSMHSERSELMSVSGQSYVPTLIDGDTVIADDDDKIIEHLSSQPDK